MKTPFRIFLLEDDESDAFLFSRALKEVDCQCEITHFDNPIRAVSQLERVTDPAAELPHLILSDLKMPIMNGHEFAKWLRDSPWEYVPVVMLSSSNLPEDIRAAYQAGANSWITKPNNYDALLGVFRTMVQYWRDVCEVARDWEIPAKSKAAPMQSPAPRE